MEVTVEVLKKAYKKTQEVRGCYDYYNKLTLLEKKDPVSSKKTLIEFLHYQISVGNDDWSLLSSLEKFLDAGDTELLPTLYKLVEKCGCSAFNCIAKIEGKNSYPFLVSLLQKEMSSRREGIAFQIVCLLTDISKQQFDDGFFRYNGPSLEELKPRVAEILMWKKAGYPDGEGFIDSFADFTVEVVDDDTRIMSGVNEYLKKIRTEDKLKDRCYLAKADEQLLETVMQRWELPKRYLDFLANYSPYDIQLESNFGESYTLYGVTELLKWHDEIWDGIPETTLNKKYLVVGDREGDPIAIILSDTESDKLPLFIASHDSAPFIFKFFAKDIYAFFERFIKVKK